MGNKFKIKNYKDNKKYFKTLLSIILLFVLILNLIQNQVLAYENHCWNCKSKISSSKDIKCPQCTWYICSKCGVCEPGCNRLKSTEVEYNEVDNTRTTIIIIIVIFLVISPYIYFAWVKPIIGFLFEIIGINKNKEKELQAQIEEGQKNKTERIKNIETKVKKEKEAIEIKKKQLIQESLREELIEKNNKIKELKFLQERLEKNIEKYLLEKDKELIVSIETDLKHYKNSHTQDFFITLLIQYYKSTQSNEAQRCIEENGYVKSKNEMGQIMWIK